ELGRIYLEENCSDHIKTVKVHNVNSEEDAVVAMKDLILMGVKIIFTTSSKQVKASLKVAANHPEVSILNCSLNTSHKLISTYYARLYEVKFLAGMIAGALAKNGRIGYVADYPIIGMPSSVNAFALGAKMINPYARVYLEWTTVKGVSKNDVLNKFRSLDIEYVSDQIMFKPEEYNRQFGLYSIVGDKIENLAMPVYLWGVFYEKLIESILTGAMQNDEKTNVDKALNYWWGLSAGVVDLICSEKIPAGTIRLVNIIKDMMVNNEFKPFQGNITSKSGTEKNEKGEDMLPEDIMLMNWLVDNIEGEIPELEDLKDEAKGIVVLKGVAVSDDTQEKAEEADGENV
ncbi:MAG: BMP family ABC transporter substrate-binding protein, partial [Lachnospiraceae bacterium]|nr:BMP family ABC transporter substrate-binding protein [Lachnospiraceae bacterium]